MNIFPPFPTQEATVSASDMTVVTVTLRDPNGDGPQTINLYGVTDIKAYTASFEQRPADAAVHIRILADDWVVVTPKG